MDSGTPMGSSGHITGKCPCGVYHGRRRYPQPTTTPLTLSELIGDDAWLNDMKVVVRAMPPATYEQRGDDLV